MLSQDTLLQLLSFSAAIFVQVMFAAQRISRKL
jgi:hypothetical protein